MPKAGEQLPINHHHHRHHRASLRNRGTTDCRARLRGEEPEFCVRSVWAAEPILSNLTG